ncbi:hypothetical protein, conserved [Eimeria brunetti]|uniref:RNA-editing substrate-binding complex 6 protein domain-containing protein n=1 Tax=Eimeria brunetti TaxID=51314 RepID=U6LCH3_9EIME|nr:hypothetical protein, conserved [Eimeria brunetti]
MHGLVSRCIVGTRLPRTLTVAHADFVKSPKCPRELYRLAVSALYGLQQEQPPTDSPLQRATGAAAARPYFIAPRRESLCCAQLNFSNGRSLRGAREFATKRRRLDEYDSYEVTVDPKKVPCDFCRVPVHLQSAGELKDTIIVAGRMRLCNPNFWLRCTSAVKDVSVGFRPREIVAILNAYAKAGYRDASLFGRLGRLLALQAHDCRASDLAVALQAFARLKIPNNSFFDLLAVQCIRKIDELGPRGLATVAAAYGGVKHHHDPLFGRLAERVEAQAETFCSIDIIQALWGCARVSYRHSKMLHRCADQIIQRLATCTVTEALTAAEAFAALSFYRADLVVSLSSFFKCRVRSLPVRSLPLLLQTFTSFDRLASGQKDRRQGLLPSLQQGNADPLTSNAALYRAALPVIARAAICFSLTELSAVNSALRSVGLRHDLLTRVLQQELQRRGPHLTPLECIGVLQQVASRGGDGNDPAVVAAVRTLLASPEALQSLPGTAMLQVLEDLKNLHCLGALAVAASFIYGDTCLDHAVGLLGGAALLVVQRIVLQCFSSAESFVDKYRESCLSEGLRWPAGITTSERESVSGPGLSCGHVHGIGVSSEKVRMLYASICATAETVGANALVLAVCRYRTDPGAGLWLDRLMKGLITEADPNLLPALLTELARMHKERATEEEVDDSAPPDTSCPEAAQADPRVPSVLSAAQLSRRYCYVARYLMESPARGAPAKDVQRLPSTPQREAPHEGFLYGRLSVAAAGSAAKAFRSHPQPEVAQRYVKQLCDLVCNRLQRAQPLAEGEPGTARNAHAERQLGKSLARLLQSLVALRADAPPALLQQLAPRLRWLEGGDILAVLRILPTPTEAPLRQQITCAVDLRYRDLKSWRRLRELRDLCTTLKLQVDDDVAELESDVSRYQAANDGEEDIPTIAEAVYDPEQD